MRELLNKYAEAFRDAWRQRDQLAPPARGRDEVAFLPAALELVETPVSPLPRRLSWLLSALVILGLGWAIVGHLDIVAVARGQLTPVGQIKIVQPLATATVRAIHVREGQHVRAGEVLIELDDGQETADQQRVQVALASAQLEAARAQALRQALDQGSTAAHLPALAEVSVDQHIETQQVLAGELQQYRAQCAVLDSTLSRETAAVEEATARTRKLRDTLPLEERRWDDMRLLLPGHYVAVHEVLRQERVVAELREDLNAQRQNVHQHEAIREQARRERQALQARVRSDALTREQTARQRIAGLTQELTKASQRRAQLTLTAPVAGTVQHLTAHTIGGVVTSAQPLLEVVPTDTGLEVEALIENKDIGFIYPGQRAVVKVESFPFTKYGMLQGDVLQVSNNAVADEHGGLLFPARIRVRIQGLQIEKKWIPLVAGMAVQVDIHTGERRLIDYLLSPIKEYAAEGLRER